MQIAIIVDDKVVVVDRKPLVIEGLDWSVFEMDPGNPMDDVCAVHFDTDVGTGHAEFRTVKTKQANRPNARPPDWHLSAADFEKHFAFVIPAYEARQAELAAEELSPTDHEKITQPEPPIEFNTAPLTADGSWSSILANLADAPSPEEPPPAPTPTPTPPTDAEIRAAARLAIQEVAANLTAVSNREQVRYELAMQAKNGSAYASGLFQAEASDRKMTINDLAGEVLEQRKRHEALIMRVSAVETRVLASITSIPVEDLPYAVEAAIDELKKGAEDGTVV